jgi:ribonuclease J
VVVVNVDRQNGMLLGDPDIVSRGFAYEANDPDLMRQIKAVVADTLAVGRMNGRRQSLLEENLSKVLYSETRRRPIVMSVIHEQ